MRPQNHVHWSTETRFLDRWNGILNNRAIAAYLFMKYKKKMYFLCLWCIAICIPYLTQKAHFHFPKLVNFLSFWVNCSIMLEPMPAQPLRLCWRHTVPILTPDGHTNMKFLISREVTPEDGNKIIFNRRHCNGCGRLHDVSRTIHGDNTKDTPN